MNFRNYFLNSWYNPRAFLPYFLWPFSQLYKLIIVIRKKLIKPTTFNIPVIIVGNITVGGTGKTPLVIWLAKFLKEKNYKPGIVSRGYGGKTSIYPQVVTSDSDVQHVGDEAILLARHAQCPVIIDPDRVNAVRYLLNNTDCNIVISDDGLQHYKLGRDIEIAVIDGVRRFGNRWCLPAGPLREPISRLDTVDFIVTNGGEIGIGEIEMKLIPGEIYNLSDVNLKAECDDFSGHAVHAIAGIGNPDRFFNSLRKLGLTIFQHSFPDHYQFSENDIDFKDDAKIIMTEKDAVKCEAFADYRSWCMPVEAELEAEFGERLLAKLQASPLPETGEGN